MPADALVVLRRILDDLALVLLRDEGLLTRKVYDTARERNRQRYGWPNERGTDVDLDALPGYRWADQAPGPD